MSRDTRVWSSAFDRLVRQLEETYLRELHQAAAEEGRDPQKRDRLGRAILVSVLHAIGRDPDFLLSGEEILSVVLDLVGPGSEIPVRADAFTELLKEELKEEANRGILGEPFKCTQFRVGDVWYRFVELAGGGGVPFDFSQESDGIWKCTVDGLPHFIGRGGTKEAAVANWRHLVHGAFQRLLRLREFRMTPEQRQTWSELSALIDVEHYRRSAPVKTPEVGLISREAASPAQVTWLDGKRVEDVSFDQAPPEFAMLCEGQWFEAIVQRDPRTDALEEIVYVQPIDPPEEMSDEDFERWYRSLPSSKSLPESGSDWSTL